MIHEVPTTRPTLLPPPGPVAATDDPAARPTLLPALAQEAAADALARVEAGGTRWRLRSLVAMGHDAARLAGALRIEPRAVRRILSGDTATVTPALRDLTRQLWDVWWDKRPPEDTRARRRAAATARHLARDHGWCTPLGLDEEYLDDPGYRPYAIWRPATGTGTAAPFRPATSPVPARLPAQDPARPLGATSSRRDRTGRPPAQLRPPLRAHDGGAA